MIGSMSVTKDGLTRGHDGVTRCWWCGDDPLYVRYHDDEWGRPMADDRAMFEKLCLEGFQAGLSWITILRKREAFREAFDGFEIERVARFTGRDVNRLLRNEAIVRHRGKIEAAINNAKRTIDLIEEVGSLAGFIWSFEPPDAERPSRLDRATLVTLASTPSSTALSRALKKRGYRFVGPTLMYALMQSMGLVNDHLPGCGLRSAAERDRSRLRRPEAGFTKG
jgi:DNA-3-methyladenine glycosylase I